MKKKNTLYDYEPFIFIKKDEDKVDMFILAFMIIMCIFLAAIIIN